MRSSIAVVSALISTITLFGCTAKLASRTVEDKKMVEGLVYQLPATRLDIIVTHELVECGPLPVTRVVNATHTVHLVPDNRPEATFALDTTALQSGSKTIPEAKITMSNNILSAVNYKAEDKTGEIIGKVAEIAALAQGITIPKIKTDTKTILFDLPPDEAPKDDACSVMARNAMAKKKRIELFLDQINDASSETSREIYLGYMASSEDAQAHQKHIVAVRAAYLEAIVRLSGDGIDDKAREALTKVVAEYQKHLAAENKAFAGNRSAWLKERQALLTAIENSRKEYLAAYAKVMADLTANTTIQWVPLPDINQAHTVAQYDVEETYKWFDSAATQLFTPKLTEWQLANKLSLSTDCASQGATAIKTGLKTALYYRVPRRCSIQVARCNDANCTQSGKPIVLSNISLAQYGYTASLPVTNGPFENSDYAIAFNATTGQLKEFTFKSDKAALVEAATSIAKAQDLLKETDIEKMDAKKAELDKEAELIGSETALLEAEEKKLEAQRKLDAAKEPSDSMPDGGEASDK